MPRNSLLLFSLTLLGFLPISAAAQGSSAAGPPPAVKAALPSWKALAAGYAYTPAADIHMKMTIQNNPDYRVWHIAFTGPSGDTVPGLYALPKGKGPFPCALLLHGLGSDKETMGLYFGAPLLKAGVAVLALDAPLHGERKKEGEAPSTPANFLMVNHTGILDYRAALDWLDKQPDIEAKHIGLLGYSMGSMMGSILTAVDDRLKACALCVGGDPVLPIAEKVPEAGRILAYQICPSLFIGHIAPRPVLMLNGTHDHTMTKEASQRLFKAAHKPIEQVWFDSDHILPPAAVVKSTEWLEAKLK